MVPSLISTPSLLSALAAALLALAQQNPVALADVQNAPSVSELTVSGGLAPVPQVGEGAPRYSPEDIQTIAKKEGETRRYYEERMKSLVDCSELGPASRDERDYWARMQGNVDAAQRLRSTLETAEQASRDAIELRRLFPQGKATQAELEAGELKRQAAVNDMVAARAIAADRMQADIRILELEREGLSNDEAVSRLAAEDGWSRREAERRAKNPLPPRYAGLELETVAVRASDSRKGDYLHVTGRVRNTRDYAMERPLLSFSALDVEGFTLVEQVAHAGGSIGPGKTFAFAFELRPAPDLTKKVEVTLANREPPTYRFRGPSSCRTWGSDITYRAAGSNVLQLPQLWGSSISQRWGPDVTYVEPAPTHR